MSDTKTGPVTAEEIRAALTDPGAWQDIMRAVETASRFVTGSPPTDGRYLMLRGAIARYAADRAPVLAALVAERWAERERALGVPPDAGPVHRWVSGAMADALHDRVAKSEAEFAEYRNATIKRERAARALVEEAMRSSKGCARCCESVCRDLRAALDAVKEGRR